jgi:hypothetical protein
MNGRSGHALGIASGHENGRESGRVRMPRQVRSILACSPGAAVAESLRQSAGAPAFAGLAADEGVPAIGPNADGQRRGRPTYDYRSAQCQVRIAL